MELNPTQSKLLRFLFFLLLFTGVFLRLYQYFMGRSMWEDETHLALNLMKYGYRDLLHPLDFIQGAPILFLYFVKSFNVVFGYSEYAFRGFQLITALLTLPLFYYIILNLTKNKITALIGFFLLATNVTLVYFSSELKPYSVDVSVYLLMIYLAVSTNPFVARNRVLLLSIGGCISLMVSLSAFVILFCIACNMFLSWYRHKAVNKKEIAVMFSWAVVFGLNYYFFIHNHPSTAQQRINYATYFAPLNIFSAEFVTFLNTTIDEVFFLFIFRLPHTVYIAWILLIIFVAAVYTLIKERKYTILLFTCLPIITHLVLSAFKFYPFVYRLILYLVPAVMFLLAVGIYSISTFFSKRTHWLIGTGATVFFCSFFVYTAANKFPIWDREIKPALDFVNDSIAPGEHVYLFDPVHAYMYYEARGVVKKPLYRSLEWELDSAEFNQVTANETSNFVLFYNDLHQWGYGDVIAELKRENRVVKNFHYNGFEVSEITPIINAADKGAITLDHTYFDPGMLFGEQKIIALWSNGPAMVKPVFLEKGNYIISIVTFGTPAEGIYPHLNLYVNDSKLADFYTPEQYKAVEFNYEAGNPMNAVLKIQMDNDFSKGQEDRNAFISYIKIKKADQ